jgi:multidrug efflux pump subunit AcrA (membrane-fusion protein)
VTATKGNLVATVVGTGHVQYEEPIDIQLPAGIIIDEVSVASGETILAGDVLAVINSISLKKEIEAAQSQINDLDKQINSAKDIDKTEPVKTQVGGRIKKIYAEKGNAALDVHVTNGALITLSIDGKMAVEFASGTSLAPGDEVAVILENGNARNGTVEQSNGGVYIVTLTDNGPELDEAVTIKSKDGDTLGTGVLYIHQPIGITAVFGKIKTIHVSENEKVSSGKTLITLEDLPASPHYEQLLADREELIERLNELLELAKTNTLIAHTECVIMSVHIAAGQKVDNQLTAFTAAPNETLVLSVNVDELDILSTRTDMDVEILFDAISGQAFYGKIVYIADSATASGGVAKYSVKVRMPWASSMRVGMNATATIIVEEKNDILLIPIVALQESGSRVFVYTKQRADTGELSDEVDVTTGISDGKNVEIMSGLTAGNTIYYALTSSETVNTGFAPGGLGGMGGNRNGDN